MKNIQTINTDWAFKKADMPDGKPPVDIGDWETVDLPHTWNAEDLIADIPTVQSGESAVDEFAGYGSSGDFNYYRGVGWYHRKLPLESDAGQDRVFLQFDGANQDAVVYVNSREVGKHFGGYTAFCFDVTQYLTFDGEDTVSVKLSNAHNEDVPPIGGDLGHFGGIYRHVHLVRTSPVHFDIVSYGASGILTDTPQVSAAKAIVRVRTSIINAGNTLRKLHLRSIVAGAAGSCVLEINTTLDIAAGATVETCELSNLLLKPRLWSPEDPYLYRVRHELLDVDTGELLDEHVTPLGFRWFSIDADKGFLCNGQRCQIRGIGRHQDYAGRGYAVSYETLLTDTHEIKELGANFMRGHYPLVDEVYSACDQFGIMCWVKIPVMDKVGLSLEFRGNTEQMLREMVFQLYNHPAIIIWGYMCEVLGDADWFWPKPQDPDRLAEYQRTAYELARELQDLTKQLDPSRLIGNDFHMEPSPQWYRDSGLTEVNDFNGWNLYHGWYHASLKELPEALAQTREFAPDQPYVIAEFGAGTDRRLHSHEPTIYDMTPEYAERLHQTYLAEVVRHTWIAGMFIWTLSDFQRNSVGDTMKHVNNKGMLTGNRQRKDTFYLYKAHWNPTPMVYIAAHDWFERVAEADTEGIAVAPISIYTNQSEIELFHDGISLGIRIPDACIAIWDVGFHAGENKLQAVAGDFSDELDIDYQMISVDLKNWNNPNQKLCVNVGQSRVYFNDPITGDRWLPDQSYTDGSFGHLDGDSYRTWTSSEAWDGIREGVRHSIHNTELDPVFQTFLVGLTSYKFDVPDGEYLVELYLTEPFSLATRCKTEEKTGADAAGKRVFSLSVNDESVCKELDLAGQFGAQTAVIKKINIVVENNRGIEIRLAPVIGEPVLSGITIITCE